MKHKRCNVCNCERTGNTCFKCNSALVESHPDWVEPKIPDVNKIRRAAYKFGYAIGEHGSLQRDLDLIAVAWVDDALLPTDFMRKLAKSIGGKILYIEKKPLGRIAATIQLDGYLKPIDLSVAPHGKSENYDIE